MDRERGDSRVGRLLALAALAAIFCLAGASPGAFFQGGGLVAWGADMEWEAFKEEYGRKLETDKAGDGQTIKLTGDLDVGEDWALSPTKGRLTLDAGPYAIRVAGGHSLRLDNPNLTIQASGGSQPVLTLDGGGLTLLRGSVTANGRPALLLESGAFKLDAPSGGFQIQCAAAAGGRYPHAITSKLGGLLTLRGLTLNATGGILGIRSQGGLRLEWCKINVAQAANQPAVSAQTGSVTLSASQVSPSPSSGGSQVVVEQKDIISQIAKPEPCFLLGNTETSQLPGKLPAKVTAEVTAPDGSKRAAQLAVDWKVGVLPKPTLFGGNAYVLEGQIPESGLMQAEVTNPGALKASLNLLVVKRGPIESLQGSAKWKAAERAEVELWLPCPNEPAELYLEYSTDQQNWVVDREPIWDASGNLVEIDNLWRILAGSEQGMVDPAAVRSDGKVKLTCSLDLTKAQAVRGFWVRLRLGGSEYDGISNSCRFKLRSTGGQGGAQYAWSFQSDTGDFGGGGEAEAAAPSGEESWPEESESESEGADQGGSRGKRGGANGPEGTDPEGGNGPAAPPDSDDGEPGGQGGRSGGYVTGRGRSRFGSDASEASEETRQGVPGWIAILAVGAVLAVIFVLYRKWLKKYM